MEARWSHTFSLLDEKQLGALQVRLTRSGRWDAYLERLLYGGVTGEMDTVHMAANGDVAAHEAAKLLFLELMNACISPGATLTSYCLEPRRHPKHPRH